MPCGKFQGQPVAAMRSCFLLWWVSQDSLRETRPATARAMLAELRTALHTAGVDNNLATSLYTVAMGTAKQDRSPVAIEAEYINTERTLRQAWGGDFDANLKAANAEGRRLFDAMPERVRRGMTYAEYARAAGFANSAPIAKMLLARVQGRSRTSKAGR